MSDVSVLLGALSHPIRLRILNAVERKGKCTFTELMRACNLSVEHQCGVLDYHLKRLLAANLISYDERGGYKLTESGVKVIKALKDSLLNDLSHGIDVEEEGIVVEELREDNLELVRREVERMLSGIEPAQLLKILLNKLKDLVTGTRVKIRKRVISGILERYGVEGLNCDLEEEVITLVVFYKGKLIGVLCGLAYDVKFSLIEFSNSDKYNILGPTKFFKVYDIVDFWISSEYNRAKILDVVISKLNELSKKYNISWITWRVPSHFKEVSEYLERKGYYSLTSIYSNIITSVGSKALTDHAGLGPLMPLDLVEVWRLKVRDEMTWVSTHYERIGGILTRTLSKKGLLKRNRN